MLLNQWKLRLKNFLELFFKWSWSKECRFYWKVKSFLSIFFWKPIFISGKKSVVHSSAAAIFWTLMRPRFSIHEKIKTTDKSSQRKNHHRCHKKNACQLTKKFDMAKHILLLWWNQFSMSYPCLLSFGFLQSRLGQSHRNCNSSGKICTYINVFAWHHKVLKSRKN